MTFFLEKYISIYASNYKLYAIKAGKAIFLIVFVLFSIFSFVPRSFAGDILAGPIPAKVVHVKDGDSLQVSVHIWLDQIIETTVRLRGIDSPELRGKCPSERQQAKQAKHFLRDRLQQGPHKDHVWLYEVQYGKYAGRVLATVIASNGENLSDVMLAAGLARPYQAGSREVWCEGS